jgi:hypothetical protein
MIAAAQFKKLYSQIPETAARTLFSPILMLRISAEKSWDRVYMERENQVGIYLLDRGNNVLSYTTLTDQQLRSTGTNRPSWQGPWTSRRSSPAASIRQTGFSWPWTPFLRRPSGACSPNPAPCWPLTGHRFVWGQR